MFMLPFITYLRYCYLRIVDSWYWEAPISATISILPNEIHFFSFYSIKEVFWLQTFVPSKLSLPPTQNLESTKYHKKQIKESSIFDIPFASFKSRFFVCVSYKFRTRILSICLTKHKVYNTPVLQTRWDPLPTGKKSTKSAPGRKNGLNLSPVEKTHIPTENFVVLVIISEYCPAYQCHN